MKRIILLLLSVAILVLSFCGCNATPKKVNIAATTRPVWEFTTRLCRETDLSVELLIAEPVSCLHDYSLSVRQAKLAEAADIIVISGAGLEESFKPLFSTKNIIDCSEDVTLLSCPDTDEHEHTNEHEHHTHDVDAHIWLSPANAKSMVNSIYQGLILHYPQHKHIFERNFQHLTAELDALLQYGHLALSDLSTYDLITFHDGFSYFAEEFGMNIVKAIEEESGSEASAAELKELIHLVDEHKLPAIFTEANGSVSAAGIIAAETGVVTYALDMAMSERSYFEAMYHNIDTIKEAMG